MTNYWIKDQTRKEIITKTQIPNSGDFELLAYYFNLMDRKGLSFHFDKNIEFESDRLFIKNGFEYVILKHDNFKELLVLPNENLEDLTKRIVAKMDICCKQSDVVNLVINQMSLS